MVTGASGFIGRHCAEALLQRGCEVHGVSSSVPVWNTPGLIWHRADLLQPSLLSRLLLECHCSHLIHAAWNVSSGAYWTSAENLTWGARSIDLLLEAQRHGIARAVGIGTCAEYGFNHELCDERATLMRPVGVYAQAKHATQMAFEAAGQTPGLSTAWARLFFPYGPSDKPGKLIPYTIRQLSNGEPAEFSSGEQVRDLLFASDVGKAIVALLFSDITGAVNVASGQGIPVCEIVTRIGELMGKTNLIHIGVRQAHRLEAKRWVASVSRLSYEVQWSPTTSFEHGLQDTIDNLSRI